MTATKVLQSMQSNKREYTGGSNKGNNILFHFRYFKQNRTKTK